MSEGEKREKSCEGNGVEKDVEDTISAPESTEKEKSSLKVLIWAFVIMALVIVAIFSLKYFAKFEKKQYIYKYNGFEFRKIAGLWYTQVQLRGTQLYTVPLHYSPRELENISVYGALNDSFYSDNIYVTFDPDEKEFTHVQLAAGELTLNLVQAIGIVPVAACTKSHSPDCDNRTIVTCESGGSVIYLKQSDAARIVLDGRCITVEGRGWDIVRATDRLVLQWYGIMN